jgi:hypothetical protein
VHVRGAFNQSHANAFHGAHPHSRTHALLIVRTHAYTDTHNRIMISIIKGCRQVATQPNEEGRATARDGGWAHEKVMHVKGARAKKKTAVGELKEVCERCLRMRRVPATYARDRVCHSPLVATRSTLTGGVFQSQAHDAPVGCLSERWTCVTAGRRQEVVSVSVGKSLTCSAHLHTHTHTPHTHHSGENKHAAR